MKAKKCLHCKGKTDNPKFCSRSCSVAYNNALKPKRASKLLYGTCKNCSSVFRYRISDKRRGSYCSLQCQQDYTWEEKKKRIRKTKQFNTHIEARRYLKEKYGHVCKICKRKTWQGKPIPLVLDHIDGNSDNWAVSNIRRICANCDAQTDTYKGKNKGNGRHARRERYRNGLSY